MEISRDIKKGWLYWGEMPLPAGGGMLGTVKRDNGKTGVLIKLPYGYVQGSAGSVRSLPKKPGKLDLK